MTAKEYLSRIRKLKHDIKVLEDVITEIRNEAAGVKAIDYSKDKIQVSPTNKVEDLIIKAIEKENKLSKTKEKYINELVKITTQLTSLERAEYSELLYKRYIEFKSLEEIAVEMNYSYDRIRHMHGWALMDFHKQFLE